MWVSLRYIFLLGISVLSLKGQQSKSDSIKQLLATDKEDTVKVNHLTALFREYRVLADQKEALTYALESEKLATKLDFKKGLPPALSVIGNIYQEQGDYLEAMRYHARSLKLKEEARDSMGITASFNSIGNAYLYLANYPEALSYYQRALKLAEKIRYWKSACIALNNIVIIYNALGEYKKAEENLARALQISLDTDDKLMQVNIYNNYGNIYSAHYMDNKRSRAYFQKALEISESVRDEHSIALSLGNIGITYLDEGDLPKALDHCLRSLQKHEETQNTEKIAYMSVTVGNIYKKLNKIPEALMYCNRGLKIANEIGSVDDIMDAEHSLTDIYEAKGDPRSALIHYKGYIAARDSAYNEENTKKMVKTEMNFEFEKKEEATRLEQEKKEAVAAAEVKKQRVILFAISGFGLLVLGFAIFAYRSFLQKKKANVEINRQKQVIEEKQKEILDSIHYARRIQQCLLPNEKYVYRVLKELQRT